MRLSIPHLLTICFLTITINSFAQKKPPAVIKTTTIFEDSVETYEVEIDTKQKDYREQLAGAWSIDTMRRQAKANPDALNNVTLRFVSDTTFLANTGCNEVKGTYKLKGTSIKFTLAEAAGVSCADAERETMLLELLRQRVSAYTVGGDVLLLRDGSSNVVFRASRKKN